MLLYLMIRVKLLLAQLGIAGFSVHACSLICSRIFGALNPFGRTTHLQALLNFDREMYF
jgi:hypothetical protein